MINEAKMTELTQAEDMPTSEQTSASSRPRATAWTRRRRSATT